MKNETQLSIFSLNEKIEFYQEQLHQLEQELLIKRQRLDFLKRNNNGTRTRKRGIKIL